MNPLVFLVPGVAFLISTIAVGLYRILASFLGILDRPNARSSHSTPVPRGGGLGLMVGIAAGLVAAGSLGHEGNWPWGLLTATLLVAFVGFVDDVRGGLPLGFRLVVQIGAATLLVWDAGAVNQLSLPAPMDISLGWMATPITIVWLIGVTNIYNFLDGIDGLAAIQAVVAGGVLSAATWSTAESYVCLSMAGAAAGFLIYNWHPARIFMGDVGSASLGFILAGISLCAGRSTGRTGDLVFLSGLALWFFLADGVFTLGRRAIRGEKIWRAHRSHLYQRLVGAGMSHGTVSGGLALSATLLGCVGLWAFFRESSIAQWMSLGLALAAFVAYWGLVTWFESARCSADQASRT